MSGELRTTVRASACRIRFVCGPRLGCRSARIGRGDRRKQGNQDPRHRQQRDARKRQGREGDGEPGHVERAPAMAMSPGERVQSQPRSTPAPAMGPGDSATAPSDARPRPARRRRARRRPPGRGVPARRATPVNHAVRADGHEQQPAQVAPPASRREDLPTADTPPVAPGVHARGELERAVQPALQHRDGDPPHAAQPFGRDATLTTCLAHDPDRLDEFRRE